MPDSAKPAAKPAAKKPAAKAASKPAAKKAAPKKSAAKTVAKTAAPKAKTQGSTNKVKSEFADLKSKAADGARTAAEKGKDRASEAVGSIGKLIRDSASTIDEKVGTQYGDYARSAADAVEGFADKVDAKQVDDIVSDTRDFIRKSPAVAIGAAAAIGFVLARLVRSGRDDA